MLRNKSGRMMVVGTLLLSLFVLTHSDIWLGVIIYKGITKISLTGSESSTEYFMSFAQYTDGCDYEMCFYGWVNNYTVITASGQNTVQGYPNGSGGVKPMFQLKANSKTDFVIRRHPQLADPFVSIIEIGCEMFEPTLNGDTQILPTKKFTLDNIKTTKSEINEIITFENNHVGVRRRIVDLIIPSDHLTEREDQTPLTFNATMRVQLIQYATTNVYQQTLVADVNNVIPLQGSLKAYTFTASQIQAKRRDPKITTYYDEYYKEKKTVPSEVDIATQFLDAHLASKDPTPGRASQLLSEQLKSCKQTDQPFQPVLTAEERTFSSKMVFGRRMTVELFPNTILVGDKTIRFKAALVYEVFGKRMAINSFDFEGDYTIFWTDAYFLQAEWRFKIYVPLPAPVSFLGVTFSFKFGYLNPTRVYVHGSPSPSGCKYESMVGSLAKTRVNWDVSASVKIMGTEGGVFAKGMISLVDTIYTDSFILDLRTKKVISNKVQWKKAFFVFGFYWGNYQKRLLPSGAWTDKEVGKQWYTQTAQKQQDAGVTVLYQNY